MNGERRVWFDRCFAAGNRPKLTAEQENRIRAKIHTLEEVVQLARMYEQRGATAGVVRLALEQRAKDTRAFLDKFAPLGEEPNLAAGSSPSGDESGAGASCSSAPSLSRATVASGRDVVASPLTVGEVVRDLLGVKGPEHAGGPPKLRLIDGGDAA